LAKKGKSTTYGALVSGAGNSQEKKKGPETGKKRLGGPQAKN